VKTEPDCMPDNSLDARLLKAIDVGDTDSVRELLGLGADPHCVATGEAHGNTRRLSTAMGGQGVQECPAIVLAAMQGSEDAVELLLEAGADPNAKVTLEGSQFSALLAAAGNDQGGSCEAVVRMLIANGADPTGGVLQAYIRATNGRMIEFLLGFEQPQSELDGALSAIGSVHFNLGSEVTLALARKLISAGARVNTAASDSFAPQPVLSAVTSGCGPLGGDGFKVPVARVQVWPKWRVHPRPR
jgi:hypothetical protein